MKKIFAALVLLFALPVWLISCTESNTEASGALSDVPAMGDISVNPPGDNSGESLPAPEGRISVVVLGDSIARGYGLENVETQRFSTLLGESLKKLYAEVSIENHGVDGQTGAELLEYLQTSPAESLKNCDCVIVSIGGNNILGGLQTMETALSALSELDPNAIKDYFNYIMASEEDKSKYEYACDILSDAFGIVNDAFQSDTYKNLIKEAGENLVAEIPLIVSKLRELNPEVKIYIQTVYNPYKGLDMTLDGVKNSLNLGTLGEEAVAKLNAPINDLGEANGYTVVPVWEGFNASDDDLVNARFEVFTGEIGFDPHPNAKGHEFIAEIYYDIFTEIKND